MYRQQSNPIRRMKNQEKAQRKKTSLLTNSKEMKICDLSDKEFKIFTNEKRDIAIYSTKIKMIITEYYKYTPTNWIT
jgi:hypothetical protein